MNFALTPEQAQLQDGLHRMIGSVCPALAVHKAFDGDGKDPGLWRALVDFGLPGLVSPESVGGSDLRMIDLALAAEILGYHAAPVPFLGHALATLAMLAADDAPRAEWLSRLTDGSVTATVALDEPGCRWLPAQWKVRFSDGRLSGRKEFVPTADDADLIVVGVEGGGLVAVDATADGVVVTRQEGIDRTRPVWIVEFTGTPGRLLTSDPDAGTRLVNAALVLLAADAFGGARRVLDMAVQYAGEREQFGVKIGSFQAVRHQLANMATFIEPARGLYWYAAYAFDHIPEEASSSAALAKSHLAECYLQAARDATEVHGGLGYTWEYDAHIWLKRAMFDTAWGGSPALHRERFASLKGW
jgi:alkylation response protein AidB-like acyl-CoA dehydrogenase